MSCVTTGLININNRGEVLDCDKFCNYKLDYDKASINITNEGSYLLLKYNTSSPEKPPVIYNNPTNGKEHLYVVDDIRIYAPSLHSFGYPARKTEGEIIISHTSNTSSKKLLVCIALTKIHGNRPSATSQLDTIISNMYKMANSEDESTTIPNFQLDLNKFIPNDKYYNYIATQPYFPSNPAYYIVFPKMSSINIAPASLKKLQEIIPTQSNKLCTSSPVLKSSASYSYSTKSPILSGTVDDYALVCNSIGEGLDEQYTELLHSGGDGPTVPEWAYKISVAVGLGIILAIIGRYLFKTLRVKEEGAAAAAAVAAGTSAAAAASTSTAAAATTTTAEGAFYGDID